MAYKRFVDTRVIVDLSGGVDLPDWESEVLLCVPKLAWEICRTLIKSYGLRETTYAMSYETGGYNTPDSATFDIIDRIISDFLGEDDMAGEIVEALQEMTTVIEDGFAGNQESIDGLLVMNPNPALLNVVGSLDSIELQLDDIESRLNQRLGNIGDGVDALLVIDPNANLAAIQASIGPLNPNASLGVINDTLESTNSALIAGGALISGAITSINPNDSLGEIDSTLEIKLNGIETALQLMIVEFNAANFDANLIEIGLSLSPPGRDIASRIDAVTTQLNAIENLMELQGDKANDSLVALVASINDSDFDANLSEIEVAIEEGGLAITQGLSDIELSIADIEPCCPGEPGCQGEDCVCVVKVLDGFIDASEWALTLDPVTGDFTAEALLVDEGNNATFGTPFNMTDPVVGVRYQIFDSLDILTYSSNTPPVGVQTAVRIKLRSSSVALQSIGLVCGA